MPQTSGYPDTPLSVLLGAPQAEYGIPLIQQLMNGGLPYRESIPDRRLITGAITPTSGVEHLQAVPLLAGDVITNISLVSNTALTMGSNADGHLWFSLRTATGSLILQTADQGGAATWAANTWKTLALSGGPYTVPQTALYYVGAMQNIGTGGAPVIANLKGNTISSVIFGGGNTGQPAGQKAFCGTAGSSLGASAPGSATLANSSQWFYCVTS